MKKTLGLVILTAGIALTAGYGSYLAPAYKAELIKRGEAHFAGGIAKEKHAAYCKVRKAAALKAAEGCENKKGRIKNILNPKKLEGKPPIRQNYMKLKKLMASQEALPTKVVKRRKAWVRALKLERRALKAARAVGAQGPVPRLTGWAGLGGVGFGFGLLLVIVGSWTCRMAIKDALVSEDGDAEAGPVDFGVLLGSVLDRARALQQEMAALEAPVAADLDRLKDQLDDIQKGDLARLCESGPKVQQRYGMAGFAEIFSPLSAGERKLNRLWVTLVDRHWPEAMASAEGAVADLERAVQAVKSQAD